ncbi:hypothetical protein KPL70_024267 [Citrus sinensis]|uniref:uncharacterized protein LOC102615174 n=1 Tax=Citrus sinensis TaxID=2711 RepID=UPI0003D75546|nr:uncharacterized protein LOC102615174 [Citrus sinensis]KAH9660627.1 hypothetical protein KPL70_024267 [Citrus sinensis]
MGKKTLGNKGRERENGIVTEGEVDFKEEEKKRDVDLRASENEVEMKDYVDENERKINEVGGNDFEFGDSRNGVIVEGHVDTNNTGSEKERQKKKKRKLEISEDENEIPKDMRINNDEEVSEINEDSKQKQLAMDENASLQKNYQEDSGNNSELKVRKKRKKLLKEGMNNDGIGSSLSDNAEGNNKETREAIREREQLDGNMMEKVENGGKQKKKKKKNAHNDGTQAEKLCNANSRVEEIEGHAVLEEDGIKEKKKATSVKKHSGGDKKASQTKKGVEPNDLSEGSAQKERSKKVSFSNDVQVFPSSDAKNGKDDGFVRGKRFSKEEDEMIKRAVMNYIETHGLGEEGLNMVLHCRSHPEVKHCWKEIGSALPWRPYDSIYYRAHIIFQRDENRKWTPEELELVRKFHEKHGSNWKMLANALGKHRFHVKDAWRRVRLPNQKKGQWSQEEYQKLFDLVNMDLRMRALEEKKTKHGMLRDNISWEAISDKLATRSNAICCMKWYDQLTSPMVAEGKWADTDDFHLVNALSSLDACCMDDVDWDNLLEHRSGTLCQKRWNQMVKHLGTDGNKSFPERVEILSTRYSPDVLEAREAYNSKPAVD